MKQKHNIVLVEWEDSWSNQSHAYQSKEFKEESRLILNSAGFLIQNDKCGVGLSLERDFKQDKYRHVQFIPRPMVRKVTVIKK